MGTFDSTLGAAFLGGIFTAILYGVTCVQAFIYSQSPSSNTSRYIGIIPLMVLVLWILDTIHTVFVVRSIYWYLVTNFGQPEDIIVIEWDIPAGILVTATSDTVVRAFFAWRIYVLSQNKIWSMIPVIFVALAIWAIGIVFAVKVFEFTLFLEFEKICWLLYLALGLVVVGDTYIAGILCYLLHKSRSGIKRTDSLLNRLMLYAVQTGLLTSIFSAGCFIAFAVQPGSYVFMALYFPLSKLYANALFATLNGRDAIRGGRNTASQGVVSFTSTGPSSFSNGKGTRDRGGVSVQVETTHVVDGRYSTAYGMGRVSDKSGPRGDHDSFMSV